jgi:DNA uptake protein ComE-like DNA-binding protein/endonuclease YncB( thermonuclease family)
MDGDSFHVEHDRKEYHFRLYFVDCPETDTRYPDRIREQSKHFGISPDENLKVGMKGKDFTKKILSRPFTVLTRWEDARGASSQQRFYAVIITADNRNLAEELISAGLARAFGRRANFPDGPRSKQFVAHLKMLEGKAARSSMGAWRKSSSTPAEEVAPPAVVVKEKADEAQPDIQQPDVDLVGEMLNEHVASVLQSHVANFSTEPTQTKTEKNDAEEDSNQPESSDTLLNINKASQSEIEALPEIGPALATRIIADRPYETIADLKRVKGIGDKTFASIAPLLKTK